MKRNPTTPVRGPRPSGAAHASTATLTPKEILGMLRRHVWLILFMTMLGGTAGGGGWYLVRRFLPLYRAETAIQVLPPIETDPMEIVATQVQQDLQYGHRVSLANLIKSQNSLLDLLHSDKVRSTKWFRRQVGSDADTTERADPARIVKAVKYLEKNLIAFPHREADQIIMSMTCGDPGEAALIVNEMTRLFVSQHGETKKEELGKKLIELTSQQSLVEGQISAGERELQRLREESGITDLEQPTGRYFQHTITLRLNDLELQESELELAVKQLQADIANLKALAEGPVTEQIEHAIERDPVMVSLAEQLVLLQAQLSGRLTRFGEGHRIVRQTQEQIGEIEVKRRQRKMEIADQTRRANLLNARDSLRVLEERLTELQRLRNQAQEKQRELDEARAGYEQVLKKRDERIEMLNQIKAQVEKLRIMLNDPGTPKVQRLREALPPLEMVLSRHILLWIPGGTMLGLMFGLFLAFLVEMLNDLVRTPSDVKRFLGLPLLGVIPEAGEDHTVDDIDLYRIVDQAPYSLLGESYRRCRTNIDLSGEPGPKSLLVASGNADDGKTSLACNLAEAFVAKYEKVLLIDANLRQPRLHLVFPRGASEEKGEQRRPGLTSLLMGQCEYREAIRPSGVGGLDLIYAGPPTANPADLLAGRRMKELVETAARDYDRVVIDSPPVLLVSDVKMLARLADATLLVFNAAATKRGAALRTIFELQEVGTNVIGCVLCAAEAIKGGYFRREFRAYREYLKPQLAASSA
ncbi:MAG: polysaccharide biosynthesis tyrosine autokinase [Sedimentisphaerales bacterium]|nr:polysaccharide biosynthesis tyrosine autokinase [Sedimentisphaerales bacterium]